MWDRYSVSASATTITRIPQVERLSALEIDPQAAAQAYRDRIVGPVRGMLPEAVVKSIEEQLSGACTTEIAAFDEFTELLTEAEIARTIRSHYFRYRSYRITPSACCNCRARGVDFWTIIRKEHLVSVLWPDWKNSASVTAMPLPCWPIRAERRLVLVARAQRSTLQEAARTSEELALIGLMHQYLVVNGCMPEGETGDPVALAIFRREQMHSPPARSVGALPMDKRSLLPFNLVGIEALRALLSDAPINAPSDIRIAMSSCPIFPP